MLNNVNNISGVYVERTDISLLSCVVDLFLNFKILFGYMAFIFKEVATLQQATACGQLNIADIKKPWQARFYTLTLNRKELIQFCEPINLIHLRQVQSITSPITPKV